MAIKSIQEAAEIIGLEPGIEFAVAKRKWRSLAQRYHPDRNKDSGAEELFKKYKGAWEYFESYFKGDTICKWTASPKSQSSSTSGYGTSGTKSSSSTSDKSSTQDKKSSYDYNKYNKEKANSKSYYYDEFDEKEYDADFCYDEDDYIYELYKDTKKYFTYPNNGNAADTSKEFFDSYFKYMDSCRNTNTFAKNIDIFLDGLSVFMHMYDWRVMDIKYIANSFSRKLWSLQDIGLFMYSETISKSFKVDFGSENIVDTSTVFCKPAFSNPEDAFDAMLVMSLDHTAFKNKRKNEFVEYILNKFCNTKDSPFLGYGNKVNNDGSCFYQKLLECRPDIFKYYVKNKVIDLNDPVWVKNKIEPYKDILLSEMSPEDKAYILHLNWNHIKESLPKLLKDIDCFYDNNIISSLISLDSTKIEWVINNLPKSYYPNTEVFKKEYDLYRKPIEDNIDVIRMNEKLAVAYLNDKYKELNSSLYKVSQTCYSFFNRDKQHQDVLDKLAESLGVAKETLIKQFDPETQQFEVMSQGPFSS